MTTASPAADRRPAPMLADRLWYFAPAHQGFPGKAANNIQMMKVCSATIAAGQPTTLVVPRRPDTGARMRAAGDLQVMYGLSAPVPIDWCTFPYPLPLLQQGIYAPFAAAHARRRRVRAAYARHEWTAAALAWCGVPVICELHHFVVTGALRYLFREAGRGRPVAFVCISDALRQLLIGAGCPPDALLAAHDGADLDQFSPPLDQAAARQQLGLPSMPTVCHAGHLYEGRGIETVLGAAAQLPGVHFLFVGGTAGDVEVQRARASAQGLRNVRFTGDVPNAALPAYLFAADALAMPYTSGTPTHRYMSPMKLFDYLAAGRPIISSDFPVLHEVLTADREALFVEPDSPSAFAAAVQRLVENAPRARAMGEAARATAARHGWVARQRDVLRFAASRFGLASAGAAPEGHA